MRSHSTGTIPRQDSALLSYSQTIETICRQHQTSAAWNIDTTLLQQLTDLNTTAQAAYTANLSQTARSHITVAAKTPPSPPSAPSSAAS